MKMYILDLNSSRWTKEEINTYYLQKVYREFPTVASIRNYIMGSKRGQIVTQRKAEVSKGPIRDSFSGDKDFTLITRELDKKTDRENKAIKYLEEMKKRNLENAKKFCSITNKDESNIAKALSNSFKTVEPEDTRKTQNLHYIYRAEDFYNEEGYRNYIINDDLSGLIPSASRIIGNNGMRGYPGRPNQNLTGNPQGEKKDQKEDKKVNLPIDGSVPRMCEYKETTDPDEVTQEAEERANVPSTMEVSASKGSVAFNSQHILFKKVKLAELDKLLDSLEDEIKKLEEEEIKIDYDSPDYDDLQIKIGKKKAEHRKLTSQYNDLVESLKEFR
jgi:predicted transcriptional regulator